MMWRFAAAMVASAVASILAACSSSQDGDPGSSDEPGSTEVGGSADVTISGGAGSKTSGGGGGSPGAAGNVGAASSGSSGSNGARDAGGNVDARSAVRPPDACIEAGSCPPGVWTNVTPGNAKQVASFSGCANYGTLSVQTSALHPETMYTEFNCQGVWKSTDYGLTWNGPVNVGSNGTMVSSCQGGISAAPNGSSWNVYEACIGGAAYGFWVSTNGGVDWTRTNVAPGGNRQDFYPPTIDPYDHDHLLMAGHEMNLPVQSVDGGKTWTLLPIDAAMDAPGGSAAFVFIDTGNAATTRKTWLYLPQTTGGQIGTWRTSDGGATWKRVDKNEKEHSYYQIFQPDTQGVVFMAGLSSGLGNGVLRSQDYGQTWIHVGKTQNENIVFGTTRHVYAMDGCCGPGLNLEVGDLPGTGTWTTPATPPAMVGEPGGCKNSDGSGFCGGTVQAAATSDGTHNIIVTANWNAGLWRYVEPAN
jgi:hypothetical protein